MTTSQSVDPTFRLLVTRRIIGQWFGCMVVQLAHKWISDSKVLLRKENAPAKACYEGKGNLHAVVMSSSCLQILDLNGKPMKKLSDVQWYLEQDGEPGLGFGCCPSFLHALAGHVISFGLPLTVLRLPAVSPCFSDCALR